MKRVKTIVLIQLLIVFFTAAICLTLVSKYYFQKSLPIVTTTEAMSMKIQNEKEYFGERTRENMVIWSMFEGRHDLKLEDIVTVKHQNMVIEQNVYGTLTPSYELKGTYSARIIDIELKRYEDEGGEEVQEHVVKAVLEGEEIADFEECIVSISYESREQLYVLPVDCIIGDLSDGGKLYEIYLVREKLTPWGYTNYVVPVSVEVLNRNLEYVVLRRYSVEKIVRNAENVQLGKENWVFVQE